MLFDPVRESVTGPVEVVERETTIHNDAFAIEMAKKTDKYVMKQNSRRGINETEQRYLDVVLVELDHVRRVT